MTHARRHRVMATHVNTTSIAYADTHFAQLRLHVRSANIMPRPGCISLLMLTCSLWSMCTTCGTHACPVAGHLPHSLLTPVHCMSCHFNDTSATPLFHHEPVTNSDHTVPRSAATPARPTPRNGLSHSASLDTHTLPLTHLRRATHGPHTKQSLLPLDNPSVPLPFCRRPDLTVGPLLCHRKCV